MPHFWINQLFLSPLQVCDLLRNRCAIYPGITVRFAPESLCDLLRILQQLLKQEGEEELEALKYSIRTNGFIPLEMLVISPYQHQKDLFTVIEGNRRVAAMKWIVEDEKAGIETDSEILESIKTIQAVVVDKRDSDEELLKHVLIGIRHVSGVRHWRGYQRAKLLTELKDVHGLEINKASERLGMTQSEAIRRFRAIKALQQMENEIEYLGKNLSDLYPLFHEAVSLVKVKEWLGWDESHFQFTEISKLKEFYQLLIRHSSNDEDSEDGQTIEPKLRTYLDIRSLKEIIGNEEAEEALFNPSRSFTEALAIAKASSSTNFLPKINAAIQAIKKIEIEKLLNLKEEEVEALKELMKLIETRLDQQASLKDKK